MGDKPKLNFLSRLSPRMLAPHENRSTVSLPPPPPSVPVAAPTPLGFPDARSSSVSNLQDATSNSAPPRSRFRKLGSKAKDFVMGRRVKPGAATPSPSTPSFASPPPDAPTSLPPEVLPSSSPVLPGASPIPSGDPSVVSNAADTQPFSPPERAREAYSRGGKLNAQAAETIEHVPGALDAVSSAAESYGDVLSKISVLVTILDKIGEFHPYLKAATGILNLAVKPIIEQVARDEKFQELLEQMALVYDLATAEFEDAASSNEKPATRQMKLLHKISVKSQECAGFIEEEYIKPFLVRLAKNLFKGGEVDNKIAHYKAAFFNLHTEWHDEDGRYDKAMQIIDKLPRVAHAGHTSQQACLKNTRLSVLKEIDDWIDGPESPRVLFVLGVAGSGKSTIAHTVAEAREDRLQLGSFLAFDRNDAARTPQRLLGTIAYNLAHWDEGYRDKLVKILKNNAKLADSPEIRKLWNQLIVGPAASISSPAPVLVVIDALDECPESSDDSLQRLLECLTLPAAELPPGLRVLVMSRPLPLYQDSEAMTAVGTLDLSRFSAADDILLYVRSQLLLPKKGLGESQCDDVARASDGLFQWAATACRFLHDKLAGTTMSAKLAQYLDQLVHGASRSARTPNGLPSLDMLYNTVLCATFDPDDENAMTNFRYAVSTMLCAETPLPLDVLQSIFQRAIPSSLDVVKSVLGSMGVVLEGVSNLSSPVRPMHLSFREFLLDKSRSDLWHIRDADIAHGHRIHALGGLRIMASDLRFNMHSLPSSLSSGDGECEKEPCPHPTLVYIVPNLDGHLHKVLDWGLGDRNRNMFRGAWRRLLYHKLLYFIEWSNIRDQWSGMLAVLELAQELLKGKDLQFAKDADHLIDLLQWIDHLPPHVYLSGLAFAPTKSLVRQHFMPHFRGIPIVRPLRVSWQELWQDHWSIDKPCLAWSTDCHYIRETDCRYIREDDCRYIRENGRVPSRCWDARTGDAVDVPPDMDWRHASLESADGRVKVSLSPVRGKLLANVERSLIAGPANTTPVRFAIETGSYHYWTDGFGDRYWADVSPDGNWLVVVDSEHKLRLWDLCTGLQAWASVPEYVADRQLAATFSPDSREVVSSGMREDMHYVFPIDQGTDDGDIQTLRWVNVNFKPQPQADANGEKFPDADLRCTEPDICVPHRYDHLVCHPGVRLVLGGLTVDYTDACYGTEWTNCYAGTIETEESEDEYAGVDVAMEESEVEYFGSEGETGESEAESSGSDGETDESEND